LMAPRAQRSVRLLWEVTSPDFRNVMSEAHAHLSRRSSRTWHPRATPAETGCRPSRCCRSFRGRLGRAARPHRQRPTWTYVSHRGDWLADPRTARATRLVEDRFLTPPRALTEQFVDRRSAVIARAEPGGLLAEVRDDGEVAVQGLPAAAGGLSVPSGTRSETAPAVYSPLPTALCARDRRAVRLLSGLGQRFRRTTRATFSGMRHAWASGAWHRYLLHRASRSASELLDSALREIREKASRHLDREASERRASAALWPSRGILAARHVAWPLPWRRLGCLSDARSRAGRRPVPVRGAARSLGVRLGRWTISLPVLAESPASAARPALPRGSRSTRSPSPARGPVLPTTTACLRVLGRLRYHVVGGGPGVSSTSSMRFNSSTSARRALHCAHAILA